MDSTNKILLNLLQENFPIDSRPFLVLGELIGICEDEVINRIRMLIEKGYIRRIGGVFDSRRLGYFSTLCAISVPDHKIDIVADIINGYSCVTHNYIRNGSFNMWFTLIAYSQERVEEILEEIKKKTGINEILNLPSEKVYKIKTNFSIQELK